MGKHLRSCKNGNCKKLSCKCWCHKKGKKNERNNIDIARLSIENNPARKLFKDTIFISTPKVVINITK